jgi:hypothetical protein
MHGFFDMFISGFKLFGPSGSLGVCPMRTAQRVAYGGICKSMATIE